MDELYDLGSDPFEMHNLIAEPTAHPKRREMEDRLRLLLDETKE
jgi:hypothetical protein